MQLRRLQPTAPLAMHGTESDGPEESRTHWQEWHDAYDDQGSSLSKRLAVVQRELTVAIDDAPSGPFRVLSLCAGDARDILGVLAHHPRRAEVELVLVELDEGLLSRAEEHARRLGLARTSVVNADAGETSNYSWVLPVDVLIACGIFGNLSVEDIEFTISSFGGMVTRGGSVLWTRHRRPPDLTPVIREWFSGAGFDERSFTAIPGTGAAVGRGALRALPTSSEVPARLFDFVGDGSGAHF